MAKRRKVTFVTKYGKTTFFAPIKRGITKDIFFCPRCKQKLLRPEGYCANKRPPREVFCQLRKGHVGNHRAVIFWE